MERLDDLVTPEGQALPPNTMTVSQHRTVAIYPTEQVAVRRLQATQAMTQAEDEPSRGPTRRIGTSRISNRR